MYVRRWVAITASEVRFDCAAISNPAPLCTVAVDGIMLREISFSNIDTVVGGLRVLLPTLTHAPPPTELHDKLDVDHTCIQTNDTPPLTIC